MEEPRYILISTENYCIIAAQDLNDATIGYIVIRRRTGTYGTRRYAEISELEVREANRRNGIGTELVSRARRWATGRNYTHIAVEASATSNSAIQFYGTCGFNPRSVVLDLEL